MRALLAACVAAWVLAAPAPAQAWGLEVHRLLTLRVIDGLPSQLKPFFAEQRDFISEHSVDPDLWRVVDLRTEVGNENPNHFFNIDALDQPAPFERVPRSWDALVEQYGRARADRAGRLPYRIEALFERIVAMLREIARPAGSPYAAENARYLVSVLSHYVQDAHQPLHVTANYDGRGTGQRGIHSRFETHLALSHWSEIRWSAVPARPVADVREFIFGAIVRSHARVDQVLRADRRAAGGRELYDAAYYAVLFREARPALEASLNEAVDAMASLVVTAWTQAGQPALPVSAGAGRPVPIRRTP
jgi:hypothetical protein